MTRALAAMVCLGLSVSAAGQDAGQSRTLLDTLYSLIWPDGRFKGDLVSVESVADPVFCPSERTLYYRRGNTVVAETLEIDGAVPKRSAGPIGLTGLSAGSLVACVTLHGRAILWIQTVDGRLVRMSRQGAALVEERDDGDPKLAGIEPSALAEQLRSLRAIQPDGLSVSVLNGALVADEPGKDRRLLVEAPSIEFLGVPTWVQGTNLLFVTGARETSP